MTEGWVVAGPWRIYTRATSAGAPGAAPATPRPAVVLVHGLGMSGRYLLPTMQRLAGRFRVLAPDLPGFGRSPRPPRPLALPALADALAAWMDGLGLERAGLLGHSLGCQVIAHLAERHPRRAECLVLASPCRDPLAPRPWQQAWRLARDAPREAPALLPIAAADYLRAGPRRVWHTLRTSLGTDAADRLRRLPHPALVVRGGRDPVVSAWWARTVADLLPAGQLAILPGAPHGLPFTSADALVGVADPFLAAHCRSNGRHMPQ